MTEQDKKIKKDCQYLGECDECSAGFTGEIENSKKIYPGNSFCRFLDASARIPDNAKWKGVEK